MLKARRRLLPSMSRVTREPVLEEPALTCVTMPSSASSRGRSAQIDAVEV